MPLYLWGRLAEPGETAWDVGRRRARRDEGAFSWRNALVVDTGDGAVGSLIGYAIPDDPPPAEDLPDMFVPLDELERQAPGTWYINVLAVLPEERGRGHGSTLIEAARAKAIESGALGLSLIVSDANVDARALYERHGFSAVAERKMVKDGWRNRGEHWVLMTRTL